MEQQLWYSKFMELLPNHALSRQPEQEEMSFLTVFVCLCKHIQNDDVALFYIQLINYTEMRNVHSLLILLASLFDKCTEVRANTQPL